MTDTRDQAFELFDAIVKQIPEGTPKAMHATLLKAAVNEHLKAYASNPMDRRTTLYSCRLVLCKSPSDEVVEVSPWQHGLTGLAGVWQCTHQMMTELAEMLWGFKAAPPELALPELEAKSGSARVAMSRKKNGVAAIRVPFSTMTGGARLVPGGPARAEDWVLRIDVGTFDAARELDQIEREQGSPLVVE